MARCKPRIIPLYDCIWIFLFNIYKHCVVLKCADVSQLRIWHTVVKYTHLYPKQNSPETHTSDNESFRSNMCVWVFIVCLSVIVFDSIISDILIVVYSIDQHSDSSRAWQQDPAYSNGLRLSRRICIIWSRWLWPSDVISQQGSRSTLAQVMACCLTAPSHYLSQCWLMISEMLWHSPDSNFTENT